jgi:AsmA family protein
MSDPAPQAPARRRLFPRLLAGFGGLLVLAIVLLIVFWNWDWFIPLVQSQASSALGRRVTLQHLHVKLGRVTTVTADGLRVDNPKDWPAGPPFAQARHLTVAANVEDYLRHRTIVLPLVSVDGPDINAIALPDGRTSLAFDFATAKPAPGAKPAPPPEIGDLRITDGTAHVVDPKFRTDARLAIHTTEGQGEPVAGAQVDQGRIVVDARGTYAAQPVTGRFSGGALLTLRDAQHPYPVDLHLANGDTRVSLVGTVRNPVSFEGADLRLKLTGSDMSKLFPLTGIPFPATPPFSIAGRVDYDTASKRVRFHDFEGRVGSSDLSGTIDEDPGIGGKPDVRMDLRSKRVDLADLGGFVGTTPGKASTPGQTREQKREHAVAEKKKTLLPDTPINLPKIRAANVHLKYRADHIENKFTPFDNIVMVLDLVDGRITVHPLDVGVGHGDIASNIDLTPESDDTVHAKADIRFRNIDLARLMQATHTFHGQGEIGGLAKLDGRGRSLAGFMANGNGELKLILIHGGNVSALLHDLAGLEFGNALLSALGVPDRATINCFVTDIALKQGIANLDVLLLDTSEARTTGKGTIDFRNQTLDTSLTTRSQHFSIGSLPGPIDISGPLGDPSIRPGTEVVARAGAAAGLGVLLTPLGALLPTIQFGVSDTGACARATAEEKQPVRVSAPPPRHGTRPARHKGHR